MLRLFLCFQALIFLAFGITMLLQPIELAARMGMEIGGRNGSFEMRGIYGGVSMAIAVLCLAGAMRVQHYARPALIFLITYMGGYLFARVAAILLEGAPSPDFWLFIFFEAVTGLCALLLLRHKV
ncbi:DUF4345 domain-containing protein [Parvularcula sp. IMCC14364]|uniref:DUF4345 domain-containing protein n=1 Tax=Parvularcula sp. IMCC14364 TaxID=3067902 RepID=UPI002740842D|nr:DUF4345 domain-containing protein [Parvularcula sp. IMCC14364]